MVMRGAGEEVGNARSGWIFWSEWWEKLVPVATATHEGEAMQAEAAVVDVVGSRSG